MFTSLAIQNFRGFSDLKIPSLDRVNIIAGKNNVGKTALLEAIYLLVASNLPGGTRPFNLLRGFEDEDLNISFVDKWNWLFHNEKIRSEISISSHDDVGVHRRLYIRFDKIDEAWLQLPVNLRLNVSPATPFLLELKYVESPSDLDDTEGNYSSISSILSSAGHFNPGSIPPFPVSFIPSAFSHTPQTHAGAYSGLRAQGKHVPVLKALQLTEPRIRDLIVLSLTKTPMVYGELDSGSLIPIAQMGEGIGRIFSILLQIAHAENGIVLIDEIENGLHYSVQTEVWQAIADAARRSNVQIFATTHSWECIRAAHEAFSTSSDYDMRLHRLDRIGNMIEAVTYDRETLTTSVEMGLEVR